MRHSGRVAHQLDQVELRIFIPGGNSWHSITRITSEKIEGRHADDETGEALDKSRREEYLTTEEEDSKAVSLMSIVRVSGKKARQKATLRSNSKRKANLTQTM